MLKAKRFQSLTFTCSKSNDFIQLANGIIVCKVLATIATFSAIIAVTHMTRK